LPTVFASVSITILLFYLCTMGMAYAHLMPVGVHILWGFFMTLLIVLLQCLIFGFFIGSGKSIKRVVAESGLGPDWVQKTKDYKNRTSPALMLAILASIVAAGAGAGVATGSVSITTHHVLILAALFLNGRSLWICYRVIVENIEAIHRINREVERLRKDGGPSESSPTLPGKPLVAPLPINQASLFFFLAIVAWVPYLYMKFSLGSWTFPLWPFLTLSGFCFLMGWLQSGKSSRT
jgi:hypothetical protein